MNDNYAKKGLPFPDSDGVQQAAETVTGQSFAEFFQNYVAGVRELPYNDFFSVRRPASGRDDRLAIQRRALPPRRTSAASPWLLPVEANSEAQRAGVTVGDRILKLNGKPADAGLDSSNIAHARRSNRQTQVGRPRQASARSSSSSRRATSKHSSCRMFPTVYARAARASAGLDSRRRRERRCAVIRTIVMLTFWAVSILIVGPVMMIHAFVTAQHSAVVPHRDEAGNHRRSRGRHQDRSARSGEPAALAQLHLHVEPCIQPRSAGVRSEYSRALLGAGQERGLSHPDFWHGTEDGGNGPRRSSQPRSGDRERACCSEGVAAAG